MGGPSPEKARGCRRQLQIGTIEKHRKNVMDQKLADGLVAVNRTVVYCGM
jgi:hypothetical protein